MPRRLYPVVIHKDPDSDWSASFPDFAGFTTGDTVETCLSNAEDAVRAVAEAMLAAGEPLPTPTPVAALSTADMAGAALISLVAVTAPGRARRLSITLDEELLAAIDAVTGNRSGFLAEAARERLARGRDR